MYQEYGLYKESLISVVRKGKSGAEEIQEMMAKFRKNPPATLGGSPVVMVKDYQTRKTHHLPAGNTEDILLPPSNVLQFFTADGGKVSVRPSGTEPKIKFYFGVMAPMAEKSINCYFKSLKIMFFRLLFYTPTHIHLTTINHFILLQKN